MTNSRQLHFWVSDVEYDFLVGAARQEERSIGSLLRRLIRQHRDEAANAAHADSVHPGGAAAVACESVQLEAAFKPH